MVSMNRRNFLKAVGIGGAATVTGVGCATASTTASTSSARVVVVGGGTGGATAAKYIKRLAPNLDVTLVEPNATYYTCYGSNWILAGTHNLDDIAQTYGNLSSKYGINIVQDAAADINTSARTVRTAGGQTLTYDRLVVAPGMDFRYDAVPGISADDAEAIPHAWKAGPQTMLLRRQLEAMPDGGVFIMVVPGNPFRCPPGPYERAAMVAHYFKAQKPRSKILILDNKEAFSKQGLFMEGWRQHYGDMIEWVASSKGGQVEEIDVATKTCLSMGGFEEFKADVLNYIPPQTAGAIAIQAGLNDGFWCPVNQQTFQSTLQANVYVIGDASIAGAMPKSGHSANNQAKVAAAAVVRDLQGQDPLMPMMANTCYSLITPQHAISVAGVYQLSNGTLAEVPGAGGVSPLGAPDSTRFMESIYTKGWYDGIVADIFG